MCDGCGETGGFLEHFDEGVWDVDAFGALAAVHAEGGLEGEFFVSGGVGWLAGVGWGWRGMEEGLLTCRE